MEENELLEIIQESLADHTVEEALKIKKEQDDIIKESFDVTWQNYDAVSILRKEILKSLSLVRFRMIFLRVLTTIINYNALGELDYLSERLRNSTMEIKDQKKLLDLIKSTIVTLQNNDIVECNYNLCELLSNIYDKDQLLFNTLVREIEISSAAIKGINITYPDSPETDLNELDNNINNGLLKLGLNC